MIRAWVRLVRVSTGASIRVPRLRCHQWEQDTPGAVQLEGHHIERHLEAQKKV